MKKIFKNLVLNQLAQTQRIKEQFGEDAYIRGKIDALKECLRTIETIKIYED